MIWVVPEGAGEESNPVTVTVAVERDPAMWLTAVQIIFFRYRGKPRKTNYSTRKVPQAIRSAFSILQHPTLPFTFYIARMSFSFLCFASF